MLPSNLNLSKFGRRLPLLIAALVLAGCVTQTSAPGPSPVGDNGQAGSAWYLQQMQHSADDSKTGWQLLAIRSLLQEGQLQQAAELLNSLPSSLSTTQAADKTLSMAQLKILQQDMSGATALLTALQPTALDSSQQKIYYQEMITANQSTPSLTLLRAYIAQEPLLSSDEHQKNIDATWQALTQLTPDQMNNLVINADENTLQGWLELQQLWRATNGQPDAWQHTLKDWQTRYPNNPGARTLPTALSQAVTSTPSSGEKIALLLPLNGQAALFGRTIQQGFNAGRNAPEALLTPAADTPSATPEQNTTLPDGQTAATIAPLPVPAGTPVTQETTGGTPVTAPTLPTAGSAPQSDILVYDTSTTPVDQLLTRAQQDGATLIVGPLLKDDVDTVVQHPGTLPVLALNQPENITATPNICYFSLSPEDEARDAARHIWQQQHHQPLLLIPANNLGNRIATAFTEQWQSLGGGTVLQQRLGNISDLKRDINRNTGIALTGTPVTVTQQTPSQTPAAPAATIPTVQTENSNGGIDAVYIIATPDEIALIKPMITMRTGSRSTAQLYASSRSIQAGMGPDFRLEMEGLQFSDIPMLAGNNPPLEQQALPIVNNDYSLARLYAMGVDAWSLAHHFAALRQDPSLKLNGNTGELTAGPDCVINRALPWRQFTQGQIVPVAE